MRFLKTSLEVFAYTFIGNINWYAQEHLPECRF